MGGLGGNEISLEGGFKHTALPPYNVLILGQRFALSLGLWASA